MVDTPARVLLAEDDPTLAKPLVACLKLAGYSVHWVGAMRELRHEAEVYRPDILVLDNSLDSDGLEFLQAIRFSQQHPRDGVVVMSESVSVRERGLQLGAAAALAKPVAGDDLVAVIEELLA